MCVITTYLVINVLDIIWLRRGDERKVKMLSYVALPVAILVHSVTAWIFGLEIAKEAGTRPSWPPSSWHRPATRAWRF